MSELTPFKPQTWSWMADSPFGKTLSGCLPLSVVFIFTSNAWKNIKVSFTKHYMLAVRTILHLKGSEVHDIHENVKLQGFNGKVLCHIIRSL